MTKMVISVIWLLLTYCPFIKMVTFRYLGKKEKNYKEKKIKSTNKMLSVNILTLIH